jgi:CRISPR-associated protein Cas2
MERLRWELEKILTIDDRLLILSLCEPCERRVAAHNRPESWLDEAKSFEIA